ncbi:double-CXXCG motif protein [Myxococcus sp. Y35]|uniref:SitI6 family double-CXXCG motif immunity protein n=1 Tax=Pseudomyxococcus flavus TaxID=3115648 RepID=UPI003CF6D220
MSIYKLAATEDAGSKGELNATHPWILPGLENCVGCGATWATTGLQYPCVDLSAVPEQAMYREPRAEPHDALARLTEQLRPWMPPGILLNPGASFGPMTGTARGRFGGFHLPNPWTLCMRKEALEKLSSSGVQGLQGCRINVRYRGTQPPELFELQLELHGSFHRDCLPAEQPPPCERCGREDIPLPDPYILDAATLPTTTDVFRLADWPTLILATQRFVDTVRRLELDGVVFHEVPVR